MYIGQPLDTVKVKLQTFPERYPTAYHCFRNTLKTNGISNGLYAGTIPSLMAQVIIHHLVLLLCLRELFFVNFNIISLQELAE